MESNTATDLQRSIASFFHGIERCNQRATSVAGSAMHDSKKNEDDIHADISSGVATIVYKTLLMLRRQVRKSSGSESVPKKQQSKVLSEMDGVVFERVLAVAADAVSTATRDQIRVLLSSLTAQVTISLDEELSDWKRYASCTLMGERRKRPAHSRNTWL